MPNTGGILSGQVTVIHIECSGHGLVLAVVPLFFLGVFTIYWLSDADLNFSGCMFINFHPIIEERFYITLTMYVQFDPTPSTIII